MYKNEVIMPSYSTLSVEQNGAIAQIRLNRPDKANAMNLPMWEEIGQAFQWADQEESVRVVILSGEGKHFCSGIDLMDFSQVLMSKDKCEGRKREKLRHLILKMQGCLTAIEACRKPVLAAIQSACIGGGIDMVACCDMRYGSADAYFEIKEIDVGMVADVGTLQRLPHIIGDGVMRELAYTGRRFEVAKVVPYWLINKNRETQKKLIECEMSIAQHYYSSSAVDLCSNKKKIKKSPEQTMANSVN